MKNMIKKKSTNPKKEARITYQIQLQYKIAIKTHKIILKFLRIH